MSIRAYSVGRNGMPERVNYAYRGIDRDTLTGWLTDAELAPYVDDSYTGLLLAACGTPAAYRRHLRNGDPACERCLQGLRVRNANKCDTCGYRRGSANHQAICGAP